MKKYAIRRERRENRRNESKIVKKRKRRRGRGIQKAETRKETGECFAIHFG